MLALKPNCENCDKELPVNSTEAMICTYECTFCQKCVEEILRNVCPNCGGGFVPRPIRPKLARRPGVSAEHQPPSTERIRTKYSIDELKEFSNAIRHIKPEDR